MKKFMFIVFYILVITSILLDWSKWDIGEKTSLLFVNFTQLFVVILLVAICLLAVFIAIRYWKTNRFNSILAIIITVLLISSFTFLPISKIGIKTNYMLNQNFRENVVSLLNEGKLSQSGINKFSLPIRHRLSSHTGEILVQSNESYTENYDKILFYIHCGHNISSAIIYSAEDSVVCDGDFGRNYCSIERIKPKWYMVTMTWEEQ